MYRVTNQKQMNQLLKGNSASLYYDFGIDLYEDNGILLQGKEFIIDSSCELLLSCTNITFIGSSKPKVKLVNCEKGLSAAFSVDDDHDAQIPIFTYTYNVVFQNVDITADEFTEIQFFDMEEFNEWKNVYFDTSMIRVLIDTEENEKLFSFLNSYNVEGILDKGDHIVVNRGIYTHHGIYIGNNKVIHYQGFGQEGIVIETSLEYFVKDDTFWVYEHTDRLGRDDIIKNAKSRLHEDGYNLISNNCEHFAHWCCTGKSWSNQVFGGLTSGVPGVIMGNIANDGGAKKYRLQLDKL